jgi:hypothetical protein
LLVLTHEDIVADPKSVLQETYQFFGVDADFVPQTLNERVNVAREATRPDRLLKRVEILAKRMGLARKHLVSIGLAPLLDDVYRIIAARNPPPSMCVEDRAHVLAQLHKDIAVTEEILGLDLSRWKDPAPRNTGRAV